MKRLFRLPVYLLSHSPGRWSTKENLRATEWYFMSNKSYSSPLLSQLAYPTNPFKVAWISAEAQKSARIYFFSFVHTICPLSIRWRTRFDGMVSYSDAPLRTINCKSLAVAGSKQKKAARVWHLFLLSIDFLLDLVVIITWCAIHIKIVYKIEHNFVLMNNNVFSLTTSGHIYRFFIYRCHLNNWTSSVVTYIDLAALNLKFK